MIIKSILDNDLYKFSMAYSYMKLYPEAEGKFEFFDRGETEYNNEFLEKFNKEVARLSSLSLSEEELSWCCNNILYIPQFFWEWLRSFKFNPNKINSWIDEEKHLHIEVTDKLYKSTFYEVPILAIVSELRGSMLGYGINMVDIKRRLETKLYKRQNKSLLFSEFGTRRRCSFDVQDLIIHDLVGKEGFVGTSNVFLAKKYNLKPIGTMAHEVFMFHAAIFGVGQSNYLTLTDWVKTYDGDLGIALTDTFTSKVFFDNFSRQHAKLFDGVRHDSGDPIKYVDMVIERYKKFNIDPMSKTIIFSNALTFPEYERIAKYCDGKIKCSAGIGTYLTNDTGHKPANIVMKLTKCRINNNKSWKNCVKISDDEGKHTGDTKTYELYKQTLEL